MLYDMSPSDLSMPKGLTLATYQTVFDFFTKYVNGNQIVMGFEPGGQSASGVWEGMDVDKSVIEYMATQPLGGVQFWAINEGEYNKSKEVTGKNVATLGALAKQLFNK